MGKIRKNKDNNGDNFIYSYKKGVPLAPVPRLQKMTKTVDLALGVDPGLEGAFVLTNGVDFLETWPMPTEKAGKGNEVTFDKCHELLYELHEKYRFHIFLERAMPLAMGAKHAFNYGRGFAALEIAIQLIECPVTYVEPSKWSKQMHAGISADLKPKAKSLVAVKRLYPHFLKKLPIKKTGAYKDGPIDALLIAGYGLRLGLVGSNQDSLEPDFF